MQKIKSEIFEKLQLKNKIQSAKTLSNSAGFQIFAASLLTTVLLSELKIRPLGLLFLMIFCFWFFKSSSNLHLQIPAEVEHRLESWQKRVIECRKARPTKFSFITSGCLAALAVVGHFISGSIVVLIAVMIACIMSTKHNIKIIRTESGSSLGDSRKLQPDYDFGDDFLPEESEFNMFFLEKANDFSSRTEDAEDDESKSDEVPSELLIPDGIPELNESSTDDDQDDLLPIVPVPKELQKNTSPTTDAMAKHSQSNDTIEFKSGHFKRDSSLPTSSSSSEESLSKGLEFPDHTAVEVPKAQNVTSNKQEVPRLVAMDGASHVQTFIANNGILIPTLMSGLVQEALGIGSRVPTQDSSSRCLITALESSDESDFEILGQEDFE